jgi:FkbM family methyltransferase
MGLYWQEPEAQLLTRLLDRLENRSVIDVGAERGSFADRLLRRKGTQVFLIEPEPDNAAALRARFRRHKRVVVHEYGVTDSDASLVLHKSSTPSGEPLSYGHTVLKRRDTNEIAWNETVTVSGRSLASLVDAGELPPRVGILKIDTEGHDLAAIKGMGSLDCDVVMVEHWTDLPNSLGRCPWRAEGMVKALRPRGFSHFVLVLHRGEAAFLRWDVADVPRGEFGNLVFLHDRIIEDVWPEVVNCATACAEAAIENLERRLAVIEADRAARLDVIERLDAALKAKDGGSSS